MEKWRGQGKHGHFHRSYHGRETNYLDTYYYGDIDTGPHLTPPEDEQCNFAVCQRRGNRFLWTVVGSVWINKWQIGISAQAGKSLCF